MSAMQQRLTRLRASRENSRGESTNRSLFGEGGVGFRPVAPRCGQVYALVNDKSAVCGAVVQGKKMCLKGPNQCRHGDNVSKSKNLASNTFYLRAASTGALSTVYAVPRASVDYMSEGLKDSLLDMGTNDKAFTSYDPGFLLSFIDKEKITNLIDFKAAMEDQEVGTNVPLRTPAKRKEEAIDRRTKFAAEVGVVGDTLTGTTAVPVDGDYVSTTDPAPESEILATTGLFMTDVNAASDLIERKPGQWEEELKDYDSESWNNTGHKEFLSSLASNLVGLKAVLPVGVVVHEATRTLFDNVGKLETAMLAHRNVVSSLRFGIGDTKQLPEGSGANIVETIIAMQDALISEQSVVDLVDALVDDAKIDLREDINNLEEKVERDVTNLQEEVMEGIQNLVKDIESDREDKRGSADGGDGRKGGKKYMFDGKRIFTEEDMVGVVASKSDGYFPIACFPSPFIFFEFLHKTLYDELQSSLTDLKSAKTLGMEPFDYWAAQGAQRVIPSLLEETRKVPRCKYHSTIPVDVKIRCMPTHQDFGDDTTKGSIYKQVLDGIDQVEVALENRISTALMGYPQLQTLGRTMLARSKKFAEELFKYMDQTYRELKSSFGDKKETWELVSFCLVDIFTTELRAAREHATGHSLLDLTSCAPSILFSSIQLMLKVEDFLEIGIKNHPSLTAAMVRFVMTTNKNDQIQRLNCDVRELKVAMATALSKLDALDKEVKDLKAKNNSLQGTIDKLKQKIK